MQGQSLAPWEVRSAVLASDAQTLKDVAADTNLDLTEQERAVLRSVAVKLVMEAHAVVRRG